MAGASWSFDKASEHLEEFCGLKISDNTIRNLCQKESVPMGRWQRNDPVANAEFIAAQGEVEFTTDGTCVNTVDGWREMRVAIFAKRNPGKCVHADRWAERKLPKPHVSVAMAAIENKETFRRHWGVRAQQLQIENKTISVLADGAHCCIVFLGGMPRCWNSINATKYWMCITPSKKSAIVARSCTVRRRRSSQHDIQNNPSV